MGEGDGMAVLALGKYREQRAFAGPAGLNGLGNRRETKSPDNPDEPKFRSTLPPRIEATTLPITCGHLTTSKPSKPLRKPHEWQGTGSSVSTFTPYYHNIELHSPHVPSI